MTMIYIATRVITFMGTFLRTFWEHLVCRMCSIPAEDVRAFKSSEMCGHVEHEIISRKSHSLAMCFAPFALNFILACGFFLGGSYRIVYIGDFKSVLSWLYLWLGISLAANCVPSFEDVLAFKDAFFNGNTKTIIKILVAPFWGILYGFAVLERFSLTFVIAIVFAVVFPQLFSSFFPIIVALTQSI